MQRILSLILSLTFLVFLAACGGGGSSKKESPASAQSEVSFGYTLTGWTGYTP